MNKNDQSCLSTVIAIAKDKIISLVQQLDNEGALWCRFFLNLMGIRGCTFVNMQGVSKLPGWTLTEIHVVSFWHPNCVTIENGVPNAILGP